MPEQRITGLSELLKAARDAGTAPVERWNPPYCGDIGLAIDRDGVWYYRDSPIVRPALVKLFARVLVREADGRHYLVTPAEKVDVAVADAPFLAVEMQADGIGEDQTLTFRTNVDDIVVCGKERPLTFSTEDGTGGLKPYIIVRGRLKALITRALILDLLSLAENDVSAERSPLASVVGDARDADGKDYDGEDDLQLHIWSGGCRFAVRT